MPSSHHLIAFAITALVIIVVPGPSVLFIVGRALAAGRREAVLTMVGNTAGAAVLVLAVALGLGALIAASTLALTVVKLVGAAYLIYLGVHAFRARRSLAAVLQSGARSTNTRRVLRQGFLVGVTNAKSAVFFAAVLPQFVDTGVGHASRQILALGLIFVVVAFCCDGIWALVAGTARDWFARSPRRLELVGGTGGLMIIGLGASIAVTGSKE